jgi:hypothetical protein
MDGTTRLWVPRHAEPRRPRALLEKPRPQERGLSLSVHPTMQSRPHDVHKRSKQARLASSWALLPIVWCLPVVHAGGRDAVTLSQLYRTAISVPGPFSLAMRRWDQGRPEGQTWQRRPPLSIDGAQAMSLDPARVCAGEAWRFFTTRLSGFAYSMDPNSRCNVFTKSCQDAPLLAVGRNGILVRGFGG